LEAPVGGLIANENQRDQFESERQAGLVDMRREVYATYIQAVEILIAKADALAPLTPEEEQKLTEEEGATAIAAQAAVELVAKDDALGKTVQEMDQAIENGAGEDKWEVLRDDFITQAHEELFPDE